MNEVKEFFNIADLNQWLKDHDIADYEIKKIFRSPDKVYFVWYSYDLKISNEEFDELDASELVTPAE